MQIPQVRLYESRGMCGLDILEKAFTWRFGFDSLKLRKLQIVRQKQSNGECLMGMFSYSFVVLVVMIGIM